MTYSHQFDFINLSLSVLDSQSTEMSKNKLAEWWLWSGSRFSDAIGAASTQGLKLHGGNII